MPAFAVALVPRADEHRHVHGHGGPRAVGKQQQLQAVVELIFGDPFDGHDFARLGRGRQIPIARGEETKRDEPITQRDHGIDSQQRRRNATPARPPNRRESAGACSTNVTNSA